MEWAPILAFAVFLVGIGIVAGTAIRNAYIVKPINKWTSL